MDFPLCISKPEYFIEQPSLKKILMKRVPCENIAYRLRGREIWGNFRRPGTEVYLKRSMYLSVTPNLTVSNVDKPAVSHYRRFTPDGKNLLAFSGDRLSLEIYKFKGSECATQLFLEKAAKWKKDKKEKPELIGVDEEDVASSNTRAQIFSKVFQLQWKIAVAPPDESLLRESSLFTPDLRYVIVVTEKFSQETMTHLNNGSVEPNPWNLLQDYTIHLVDLHKGAVADRLVVKRDQMWLNKNQRMYLYQGRLVIFSVLYHRAVHLFQVESGHFWEIQQRGRFVFPGDESLIPRDGENNCYSMASRNSFRERMEKTTSLHLTRRIMSINALPFNASPYLDLGLFSYDDSLITSMERPGPSTGEGVKFFSRESGRLKFVLHARMKGENPPSSANANRTFRYLTRYIFHPDQPFVMSLEQQSTGEIQINFHLRMDHASVMD